MTKHCITHDQGGDLTELKRAIIKLGWNETVNKTYLESAGPVKLKNFFNRQSPETILMLIGIYEGVYGFINEPTPDMKRLQELKWKL